MPTFRSLIAEWWESASPKFQITHFARAILSWSEIAFSLVEDDDYFREADISFLIWGFTSALDLSGRFSELAVFNPRPRRVTIDLDPTDDPTHGAQQLSFFNTHYDSWCYLPVMGFVTLEYVVAMAKNAVLQRKAEEAMQYAHVLAGATGETEHVYSEANYVGLGIQKAGQRGMREAAIRACRCGHVAGAQHSRTASPQSRAPNNFSPCLHE
jgi:Transposase DDE domain group 1